MSNRFHDLSFERHRDGSIRLTQQDGCGENSIIDLHPAQLRHVAEVFGLVAPSYPADELSRRLAEQLCTILRELGGERYHSHWLELIYTKLDAWCSALPDDVFPHHLWDDDAEKSAPVKKTPAELSTSEVANAKTEARPISSTSIKQPAGQLGLEV